ncbi:MAG: hypothetical protein ACOX7R_13365 [Acetivibrionales bacterium]|jgi:hypothetical protein
MRGKKSPWLLVVLLLAGAVAGGLLGEALAKNESFSWISFGGVNGYRNLFAFSMDPLIDARILKLGFNFAVSINGGSILGMILGLIVYLRI